MHKVSEQRNKKFDLIKVAQNYSYMASTTAINNAAANHKLIKQK